ncbi:MAG: oligosaccharide flippase family protein [Burkholderiales bacterium]
MPAHTLSAAAAPPGNDAVNGTGLARRGVAAFLWGSGGTAVRMVVQLGAQIVLARLLGPETYGIFALGVLVIGVSGYFADFGLAYSLIQKRDVRDDDVRFVWTWQLMLGLAVAALVWAGAPAIAAAFDKPDARGVFEALAAVCLLNAMAAPATNLLKKALDHRALQLAQLSAYVMGYLCVGIPLALADAGILALVAAMLVQAAVAFLLLYAQCRHPVGLVFRTEGGLGMLRYGTTVLATNFVNWLLTSADKLAVGRLFPAQVVGLYTTAFNLVNAPAHAGYATTQSVVFAACARMQGDTVAMRELLRRLLAAVALLAFPAFAVLAMTAETVVAAVYGPAWAGAAPFLRIFAFALPCLFLWGVATPVMWNCGRAGLEAALQAPLAVLWCAVLWVAASYPPTVFALAAAALLVFRALVAVGVAARLTGLGTGGVLRSLAGGAVVTACMITASGLMLLPLAHSAPHPALGLIFAFATGCAVYVLLMLLAGPWLIDPTLAAFARAAAPRLPAPLRRPLRIATRAGGRS